MPSWDSHNLRTHYERRLAKDPRCFEEILAICGRRMTETEYEQASQDAFANSWAEFEAEKYARVARGTYEEARATFADDYLVVAATDLPRQHFITCFHEHFDANVKGHARVMGMTVGERRLRFKQRVYHEELAGMIRNVRRIRGV